MRNRLAFVVFAIAGFLNACTQSELPRNRSVEWSIASTSDGVIRSIGLQTMNDRADIVITYKEGVEAKSPLGSNRDDPAVSKPEVRVHADLVAAKQQQEQVDAGHTPGRMDPWQVASEFLRYEKAARMPNQTLEVVEDTGTTASVSVDKGEIERIYLERLVRKDKWGIWSVVGYDLRDPSSESESGPQIEDLRVSPATQAGSYVVTFLLSAPFQPWTSQDFDHLWVKAIRIDGDPNWRNEGIQRGYVQLTVSKDVDVSSSVEGSTIRIVVTPKSS